MSVNLHHLYDPEGMFTFAVVPDDFPDEAYDELWAYFLENCYKVDEAAFARDVAAIRKRQNGWCSEHDAMEAGYVIMPGTGGAIGVLVSTEVVQKIAEKYHRWPTPAVGYRDAY